MMQRAPRLGDEIETMTRFSGNLSGDGAPGWRRVGTVTAVDEHDLVYLDGSPYPRFLWRFANGLMNPVHRIAP